MDLLTIFIWVMIFLLGFGFLYYEKGDR